jgi:hypothetical protein
MTEKFNSKALDYRDEFIVLVLALAIPLATLPSMIF